MSTSPENLSSLPPELRLLRCHELREDALERAAHATSDTERADLVALADSWRSMAMEAEQLVKTLWRR